MAPGKPGKFERCKPQQTFQRFQNLEVFRHERNGRAKLFPSRKHCRVFRRWYVGQTPAGSLPAQTFQRFTNLKLLRRNLRAALPLSKHCAGTSTPFKFSGNLKFPLNSAGEER